MKSWVAVVDWHGPYKNREAWIEAAKKFEDDGRSDFGLYLVLGRLNRVSIAHPKLLYIGKNDDQSVATLVERIKKSKKPKRVRSKRARYWIGLIVAPDLQQEQLKEAYSTEKCLIYALDPLLNERERASRPNFSFIVVNRFFEATKSRDTTNFSKLVPDVIEYRNGDTSMKHSWMRIKSEVAECEIQSAPEKRESKRVDGKVIWDRWWAERVAKSAQDKVRGLS